MPYELAELEPMEKRKVLHTSQLSDNERPEGRFFLLKGDHNTFFFENQGGHGIICPPFERELAEPLDQVVEFVQRICPAVHVLHFPESYLDQYDLLMSKTEPAAREHRFYQTPMSVDAYDRKLKRFKKSGFEYRQLGSEDILAMEALMREWSEAKRNIAGANEITSDLSSVQSIDDSIERLQKIKAEINWLDAMIKTPEEYMKLMSQPLTAFYGTFRDGELLAYIHTTGNDSFQSFHSRASQRVNSYSPQEFVDLCVAKDFVKRGVEIFDRGWVSIREGMLGLIEYKKKFGELQRTVEVNWNNVYLHKAPEYRMLEALPFTDRFNVIGKD